MTEYLSGGELFEAICNKDFFLEEEARLLATNILEAIAYCHRNNVIHRDIKPENVILASRSPNSIVKLIDFGFARVLHHGQDPPSDLRGTALYLAPEVINCVPYGKPVDMWSIGCILYILLSGRQPFSGSSNDEIFQNIKVVFHSLNLFYFIYLF